jgi:glycosyltransferase involved in cell wall biosynthesis
MRVSIITATYNRSEVLRYAIDSVRRQTYSDWEHIIVGDACTDDTEELVASYADPRLIFINRAVNYGEQSVPNNDGLRHARGELIAFLTHDDLWFADHLAALIAHLDATGADLVHAPLVGIDVHGVAHCGLTNAELRYDPSHFVPASLWLLRRALADELEGWRTAREIHASNPSQDFLVRAWRVGRVIACHPRVTALMLPSGGRPGSYRTRDASQHAELFAATNSLEYRGHLLTRMVLDAARATTEQRQGPVTWNALATAVADRLLVGAGLHPDAIRNWLRGKPKGHWIAHLRELRGLPPSPSATGQE